MPSLLIIQWGIVGFYAVIYFLLGFIRGGSKSTYFTIVAFITTFVSLYLISFISLNLILSESFTLVSLLEMINGYVGGMIPETVFTYASDPMLAAFAIAVVDLILRIVGFIVIYPMIKGLLTLIIFRPIWSFGIKKALLKRQNEKLYEEAMSEGKKNYVPKKRLKKNLLGRFWGGFMGAFQGLLVAFIVLLPVLIISGFLTVERPADELPLGLEETNETKLAAIPGMPDLGGMLGTIDDYLVQLDEMNTQGLGSYMKQITVQGVPIDRYIFDRIFTTTVKQGETETDINWINEVEGILKITRTIYDGEYIGGDFGVDDIDQDTLTDLDIVFSYFKNSDLMAYMIPTAAAFGLDNFRDSLPGDISDETAEGVVGSVQDIDWNAEFGNIQTIVEAILTFGSVAELRAYMADPYLMLDLTPEQGVELANIVRAIGDMQLMELISVGLEYATTLDTLQSKLTWIAEEERQAYLAEELSFIIDNPAFFNGQDGEFARLALLIEGIYSDEFGDVDLRQLISTSDAEAFIEAQNEEWIDNLLEKIVDLELLMNAIPVGVDYALYSQLGDLVDETLAGELETALSEISWSDEILNVGEIYKTAVQAGAGGLLKENPNYMLFVDNLFLNHMDKARTIVEKIFEESALVNAALNIASPVLVERFVTNPDVANIVREALISDPESGEVDFSVGQELNTILDIVEKVYLFTTAEELANFSGLTTESKFELFASFGTLTEAQFDEFKASFESLQLLSRVGESGLTYARDIMGVEQIYVPETVNLGEDISSILGLAYHVAKYTNEQKALYSTFESIDFAPLFADPTFRSYLLPTNLNNHSNLLISNIAHNAKTYSQDESIGQYLKVPLSLMDASPESELWKDEINALLGSIFDLAASFEDSDVLTLSYNDVMAFKDAPTSASIELITQFANEAKTIETFGSLDSSVILRSSIKQVIDSFGSSTVDTLGGYALATPAMAVEDEMLKEGMLVELIHGLALLLEDMNDTWEFTTIDQLTTHLTVNGILPAFNRVEDSTLIEFGNITIIRGVISDALLSDEIKSFGIEKLNGAQDFFAAPADFLDLDPLLTDELGVKGDEIGKLLISLKSLQLPNQDALSSFGPVLMNEMVGRNEVAGVDDLDRFFDSGILYTFLDKAFQLDGINDYVNEMLSGAFGEAEITIDITPHADILGNAVDDEPIEVGRITKDEFRNMVISLGLISPVTEVGIETFPNLVDPMNEDDDFALFLNSDYIYTVVGRLFENQGFGDYIGGFLTGAFGEGIDLDMTTPSDAKGTVGVENGIMTKYELRRLMVSFKIIGLDQGPENITEENILNLSGQNVIAGEDDLDRFIKSKYLADKLSIILTSDTVIEMMAAGRFLAADFELLPSAYTMIDGRKRITDAEFANIFGGLKTMGVVSLENTDAILDNLLALEEPEILSILDSYFLYTFIDLMLKSEASLTVPPTALEAGGEFDGMVKKSEVTDIFTALNIFNVTPGNVPDPADITISQLQELLAETNSAIVQSLLSDAIIEALGAANVPSDALESENLLTQDEIDAIVEALAVISGDPEAPITDVADAIDTLTVGQVNDLDLTETGSKTIKQMISDAIIDQINASNIPEDAYNPLFSGRVVLLSMNLADEEEPKRRLSDAELAEIILALNILANHVEDTLITGISTNVTVGQAVELKANNSLLIKQLISDTLEDVLTGLVVIPNSAYVDVDKTRITTAEINSMIDAMVVLADGDEEELVQDISTEVTVRKAKGLKDTTSLIIRQLITDKMAVALTGSTIPGAAYDVAEPTMLKLAEVNYMIDALEVLADGDEDVLVQNISTDVKVRQVVELEENPSLVIRQLITDKTGDVLGAEVSIPAESYDPLYPTMFTTAEIGQMIDALVILANNNQETLVKDLSTEVTVGQVFSLKSNTSLVINQLLSDKIVEALTTSGSAIPDAAYVDQVEKDILKDEEIDRMIDAIVVLADGNMTLPVINISTDVNVGQTQDLKENESLIIRQLITDNVEDILGATVDFPADAYDINHPTMFTQDEIKEIVDALYELADEDDSKPVAELSPNVKVGQINGLIDNESLIINQLLSDKIIEALTSSGNTIPDSAYVDPVGKDILKDTEIDAMIEAIDILSDDDNDLVTDLDTAVTIGQLKDLSVSPSIIIQRLITDSITDSLSLSYFPDEAYVGDTPSDQIKAIEVANLILALEVLAGSTVPGDKDDVLITDVPTNPTVGQTQDLKTNESLIINQLISEAIVDSLTTSGNIIPDSAYTNMDKETLKDAEIDAMIDALYILADGDESTPVANIPIDVTIGQLDSLSASPSIIIQRLMRDSIVDSVGLSYFPNEAYVGDTPGDQLKASELAHMVSALEVLGEDNDPETDIADKKIAEINMNVTVGQTKTLGTNESLIIKQLISESIVDAITDAGSVIPDDAYVNPVTKTTLTDDEITEMIDALEILAKHNLALPVASISTAVTVGQTNELKLNESVIIRQLISDAIVDSIGLTATIPDDAYLNPPSKVRLTNDEINNMIDALDILANGDDEKLVSDISTVITIGQLNDLTLSSSIIMQKLITDSIVDAVTADKVPLDAYIDEVSTNNLKATEVQAMVDALRILAYNPLDPLADVDEVLLKDIDIDVTVGQAVDLKTNGSVIIKQIMSDAIVDMLTKPKIRITAFINSDDTLRLKDSEIGYMIDVLFDLSGGNNNTLVKNITVNENTLSVDTLQAFDENSIILNRLISNAIIDSLGVSEIPAESFEPSSTTDLVRPEIDAVLEALDQLGIGTSGAGGIGMADLTFAKLDNVVNIGTTDPVKYPLGFSPIVVHLLSDPMIAAVTDVQGGFDYGVPTDAKRNTKDLRHDEIVGLVDALKLIGNVGTNPGQSDPATTDVADITINPNNFNGTMISNLVGLDTLIVYRMISKGINTSNIDTEPSHVTDVSARNYDAMLMALPAPVYYDIKISEMNHIAESMDVLGITSISTIKNDISLAKLQGLTSEDLETVIEADVVPESDANTIIYYIVSEIVDPDNTLFDSLVPILYPGPADNYYVFELGARVRLTRDALVSFLD